VRAISNEVRDPKIADETASDAWRDFTTGIPQAITSLFPTPIRVEAMQNVPDDVAKSKSGSTISQLISGIVEPIKTAHGAALETALNDIGKRLTAEGDERAQELRDFDAGANKKIGELFPGLSVQLHVPPPTVSDLFKTGTILAKEDGFDWHDFAKLGHGAQRSIQMALIQHLAESGAAAGNSASRTLLLIDEPELYLHPQGIEQVRAALRALAEDRFQILFSSHSPLLIHQDEIADTVIIRKTAEAGTSTDQPLRAAVSQVVDDGPSQTRTLFEFGNAAQIFFCDRVLIAEGTTERALIPDLYSRVHNQTLAQARIALVGLGGSSNIPKSMKILNAMTLEAKAVADLDFAFKVAPSCGLIEVTDADVLSAKEVFKRLAGPLGIDIGHDGFPTKRGNLNATEAFAAFAGDDDGRAIASRLHDRLKSKDLWLWKNGAIEDHLGDVPKTESGWAAYRARLASEALENVVEDVDSIKAFFQWLRE